MIFSVVIAVRNEVEHIEKCIESIVNQDFKDEFEILVVDGMSTDGTYELLKELQKRYRFKLLRNKKFNAASGRNIGINEATGDFIAFIDGDAVASREWLSRIKHLFETHKVAGVGGPDLLPEDSSAKAKRIGMVMTSPFARGGRLNPSTQHSLMGEEKYVEHIPTCNLCLKKEVFEQVGLFDEGFVKGQDLELNYRIIRAGFKLLYSPRVTVVHYRKNHVREFVRQIYKWAKAKVAIIKKHGFQGITSHIYLWPLYVLFLFILVFVVSWFFHLIIFLSLLFFLGLVTYGQVVMLESGRLAKSFRDGKLFFYALFLIPSIHVSYGYGVLYSVLKKDIW